MSACDSLRELTIVELEAELEELELDFRRKILTQKDYYECVRLVVKVLREKRQELDATDEYKRAMSGI